jgi:hypothetical protein
LQDFFQQIQVIPALYSNPAHTTLSQNTIKEKGTNPIVSMPIIFLKGSMLLMYSHHLIKIFLGYLKLSAARGQVKNVPVRTHLFQTGA